MAYDSERAKNKAMKNHTNIHINKIYSEYRFSLWNLLSGTEGELLWLRFFGMKW